MAPTSVTIDRGIKSVTRGVPGPPGDLTEPFTSVTLDTVNPDLPLTIAQMTWDPEDDTIQFRQNGTTLQIGQEVQWPVVNKSGADIANGVPVMAVGTTGATGRMNIAPMDGTDTANVKLFGGLTSEDIDDTDNGKVTAFGKVRDIQTNGANYGETWVDSDIIYVSPTIVGALTNIEPTAGQVKIPFAFVINSHVSSGVLAVRVTPINEGLLLSQDQKAAVDGASTPSASNVFATKNETTPSGGATGEVLTKTSGTDYDTEWAAGGGGGGGAIDYANPVSVTGAVSIPSTNAGKNHVCTGTTSDYTVNLPTTGLTSGDLFSFEMSGALTKLVTIDALSGQLIDGQQTRIMRDTEKAVLKWDGSNWQNISSLSSVASDSKIYLGSDQGPITAGVFTKVALDTTSYCNGALSCNTTTAEITILRDGVFDLSGRIAYKDATGTSSDVWYAGFFKNGSFHFSDGKAWPGPSPSVAIHLRDKFVTGDIITLQGIPISDAGNSFDSAGGNPAATWLTVFEVPTW